MVSIEKQNGRFWGYAYLRSRSEKVVMQQLVNLGIPVYLPLVPKARLHHGTKEVSQVPMIPGYIFLALSDAERTELKRKDDHIVQIELVREEVLENLLISELNSLQKFEALVQDEEVLVKPGIQQGDRILITDGSLKGMEAEVIRRDDDSNAIIVNITILNKSVEYPVSLEYLKKITG